MLSLLQFRGANCWLSWFSVDVSQVNVFLSQFLNENLVILETSIYLVTLAKIMIIPTLKERLRFSKIKKALGRCQKYSSTLVLEQEGKDPVTKRFDFLHLPKTRIELYQVRYWHKIGDVHISL